MKSKGYRASRSPSGICIQTLAKFAGASEQICRRYLRGDALPDYEKVKQIADSLQVNPGWLLFGDEGHPVISKNQIDETLLHYILKQSHYLYRDSLRVNDDYADFVLGLVKEVRTIDTSKENLLKIIDLAISSISSYEETRNKHSHAV
jgi:transcriptional regulator with XRE-family HTH domain